MGHLRTGALPRSKTWQTVVRSVGGIAESGVSESGISGIAHKTLVASSQALKELPYDKSVQSCFMFLITLAVSGQTGEIKSYANNYGINIEGAPTKLQLSRALRDWLDSQNLKNYNPEFKSLARKATVDTIVGWVNKNLSNSQLSIFSRTDEQFQPWREASSGRGFCELSRMFFSNFTSRYLKYFLSRTASSQLKTIADRDCFESAINSNVDNISQHAFETSKIVQSFSAGWFNKNAIGEIPSNKQVENFLRHSFGKIREELHREMEAGK